VATTARRFPSPWSIEDTGAAFVVKDGSGRKVTATASLFDDVRFAKPKHLCGRTNSALFAVQYRVQISAIEAVALGEKPLTSCLLDCGFQQRAMKAPLWAVPTFQSVHTLHTDICYDHLCGMDAMERIFTGTPSAIRYVGLIRRSLSSPSRRYEVVFSIPRIRLLGDLAVSLFCGRLVAELNGRSLQEARQTNDYKSKGVSGWSAAPSAFAVSVVACCQIGIVN
jgi:hypothetical protein